MKLKFDVTTQELTIVQQVLQNALPHGCKVWLFGSRAKHQAKFNSDLDLAIECKLPMDKATLRQLSEEFDESRLPYSVDVIDMHKVSTDFKKNIDQQKIELPLKENMPALRFSEFNSARWSQIPLSQLARVIDCKHRTPPYVENGVPVTSPGSIAWGELDLDSPTKRVSEKEYQSLMDHCSPKTGDLVFSRNQSLGVASYVLNKKTFVLGQDTVLIQSENDSFFIYFYLQSSKLQNQITRLSGGSTFSRINLKDIRELVISYPNNAEEQQKITDFLTVVDRKIQQLSEKHDLLTEYKKGVMQQIFSQQIRFTDDHGQPYPDWEEKRLTEFLIFKTTNSFSRAALNYDGGEVFNIHYGDIHTRFRTNFYLDKEHVAYINESIDISRVANECYCQEGDLVVADASENHKDIGKAIEIIETKGQKLLSGLHTYLARPNKDSVSTGFLGYLMQTYGVRLQIMRLAQGVSVLGISKRNLGKVVVFLPHKKEQQRITNLVTKIDNKIEQVGQQLEQTRDFKKGLQQQMFV